MALVHSDAVGVSVPSEGRSDIVRVCLSHHEPDFPAVSHAPKLERWAYNQMPKAGWRDLRLMRFDGTDLYQWWGKRGVTYQDRNFSVFEEGATEVFRIARKADAAPELLAAIKPFAEAAAARDGMGDWETTETVVKYLRDAHAAYVKATTPARSEERRAGE